MENLTVVQLKEMLRQAGLKISGRKAELIDRLLKAQTQPNISEANIQKETIPKKEIYDIGKLDKEALFNLLLMVEPDEIKIVCHSKNPRVRIICSSPLFQEAYKKKYPRKLMIGKITHSYKDFMDGGLYVFIDEKGNQIKINTKIRSTQGGDIHRVRRITYQPFKQMYPSTFKLTGRGEETIELTEEELRYANPITIDLYKTKEGYEMTIGRDLLYSVFTHKNEEDFLKRYPLEVKEFLEYLERERWWNDDIINPEQNFASKKAILEFTREVYHSLKGITMVYKLYDGMPEEEEEIRKVIGIDNILFYFLFDRKL